MQNAHAPSVDNAATAGAIDLKRLQQIPGWFTPLDQMLFAWFLDWQSAHGLSGDLVEMGVYKGKSAILMGAHLKAGETLIVCDLFGRPARETDIGAGASQFYRDRLCRQDFETNYSSFLDTLPRIVEGPSSTILEHVPAHSARFVHIDAAHRYHNVCQDIESAQAMLHPDGLVVLDDYRTAHTPGVAAAVWNAVLRGGLIPICVSESKFYGTWRPASQCRQDLSEWLIARGLPHDVHDIDGLPLIRVSPSKK